MKWKETRKILFLAMIYLLGFITVLGYLGFVSIGEGLIAMLLVVLLHAVVSIFMGLVKIHTELKAIKKRAEEMELIE